MKFVSKSVQRRRAGNGTVATLAALALIGLGAGSFATPLAASANSTSELAPAVTTGYSQTLPYSTSLTAIGEGGQASSALPVPVGLTPVTLSGKVTAKAASDGVAIIGVGTTQTEVSVRVGGVFELSLPAGTMVNSAVVLTVSNHLNPTLNDKCSYDSSTAVTVSNLSILATGVETPPATVADFFSPAVRAITVETANTTSAPVNQAVLAAVGSLSTKYGRDTVITAGLSFDTVHPNSAASRIIVITANSDATTTLTVSNPDLPTLTLAGPATDLPAAAAALGSVALGLAGSPVASAVGQTASAAPLSVLTLADLGTAQPTLAGVGRLTYSTTVSQSRFGAPMSSFNIHLVGGNTPTPPGGIVTASVLWNDLIVDSQSIAGTDTYAVDVAIDSTLVKRDNTLTIRFEAIPPGGYCTTTPLPAELDINGVGSTITGHPGQSLSPGFQRFPQVLGHTLPIAFGTGEVTAGMLTSAAHLVSSLQRASATPLTISLVDIGDFNTASYPGVVVGATPIDAATLKASLRFEAWRAVDVSGKNFTATVDGPFAALEAFDLGGRDIVLLGSTAPVTQSSPLTDSLAVQADADPFGWFVLTGDLLVAQPGLANLALTTATIVPQASVVNEFALPLWVIIAGAILVIIVVIRLIAIGRRRRRIANDDNL